MAKKSVKSDTITPELEQFINDRTRKLLSLTSKLMPVVKDAIEKDGYGALDVAEALAVCAGSVLVATTSPDSFKKVQEEAAEISNSTLKALRARKVGLGSTITGQILGQAKVLSYIAQYAAIDIHQQLEKEAAKLGDNAPADQPAARTE